ncbi:hypothetical protein FOL47_009640, partial [Perkinsus chesapeaki]
DESGQNAYKYAYKKSIGGKWSKEETNLFYKGLQLYGPDLMLISTVFGSTKTTSQLRQKLKAEAKRNPKRLNEALKNKREINIQEFEKAHGPISNSEEGGNGGGGILSNTCICTDNVVFDYEADLARILEDFNTSQDWDTVVFDKRRPGKTSDKKAVNAARRSGEEVAVEKKFGGGQNLSLKSVCPNATKLDADAEVFRHARVSTEFKTALQQARLAKKMSQADLAKAINEKPSVINDLLPQSSSSEDAIRHILNTNDMDTMLCINANGEDKEELCKANFRRLALLVHPDKCNDSRAEEAFKRLMDVMGKGRRKDKDKGRRKAKEEEEEEYSWKWWKASTYGERERIWNNIEEVFKREVEAKSKAKSDERKWKKIERKRKHAQAEREAVDVNDPNFVAAKDAEVKSFDRRTAGWKAFNKGKKKRLY